MILVFDSSRVIGNLHTLANKVKEMQMERSYIKIQGIKYDWIPNKTSRLYKDCTFL